MKSTPSDIEEAAALIRAGGLVAFPTETVYGLGADATNDLAVARVYAAKGRPSFNPLIAHVTGLAAAMEIGDVPPQARGLCEKVWPGPLTIVVPRARDCAVSMLACAGLPSIAIRAPRHPMAEALLMAAGVPIVAPSANRSGALSPTAARHVRASLGAAVKMVLDGGAAEVGVESTIVSFLDRAPVLLRAGGLARERLEDMLGRRIADAPKSASPVAPGQLESHYAPRAMVRLDAEAPRPGEAWLGFGPSAHEGRTLSASGDVVEAAANLFRMLHDIDAEGHGAIAVAPIPTAGLGAAINDRLRRAAAPRP